MHFFERMVSIAIYILVLFIFAFFIKNDKKDIKKILNFYIIVLCIFAFLYIPNEGYDLERIYLMLNNYFKYLSFEQLLVLLSKTLTPTISICYYLISKIGINSILPVIVTFIFYKNIFYIFRDTCERNNIYGFKRFLFLIFIMSLGTFLELISNIRLCTASSIIAYAFYTEEYNNKSILKNLFLYFIASTIHLAAFVICLLRIGAIFLEHSKKKIKYFFAFLLIIIVGYDLLSNYINQIIFTDIYYKEKVTFFYLPEFVLMLLSIIYIVIVKITNRKKIFNDNSSKNNNIFSILILILIIFNINNYSVFHRMGTFHFLLNIPIMGKYISIIKNKTSFIILIFVTFLLLFIAATAGNLCGYKFFVL